jgi:hypothetical protein
MVVHTPEREEGTSSQEPAEVDLSFPYQLQVLHTKQEKFDWLDSGGYCSVTIKTTASCQEGIDESEQIFWNRDETSLFDLKF